MLLTMPPLLQMTPEFKAVLKEGFIVVEVKVKVKFPDEVVV
jgi:hypothetical protein